MIAQPSASQLVRAVRTQLADAVLPALSDEKVIVEVQMMLSLLDTLAVRVDHEIAWMREETVAIEGMARGITGSAEVTAALAALDASDAASDHLPDVSRRYELASEVLSCAAEAAASRGDEELAESVHDLIRLRLKHEQEVVGVFTAVGRG